MTMKNRYKEFDEYGLRHLPTHLLNLERWDKLEDTLCDLYFIEAKCASGMTYELIADYEATLNALPEAQEEIRKKREHEERMQKYIEDLVEYAKSWTGEILDSNRNVKKKTGFFNSLKKLLGLSKSDSDNILLPSPEPKPFPEIIPSVMPWTEEEIRKDAERIMNNPTRLDRIRTFSQFVNAESDSLGKFASHLGFCFQQAYNSEKSGFVSNLAEEILQTEMNDCLLQIPAQRNEYNSHPHILTTIELPEPEIFMTGVISMTPDGKTVISGNDDGTLCVLNLEKKELEILKKGNQKFKDAVQNVSITPNGTTAIYRASIDKIFVWDIKSGECLWKFDIKDRMSMAWVIPFITAGGTAWVMEWILKDIKSTTKKIIVFIILICMAGAISFKITLFIFLMFLSSWIGSVKHNKEPTISVSADGRLAVSNASDGIRVWDMKNGEYLKNINSFSMLPLSSRHFSGMSDGKLTVWNKNSLCVWDLGSGKCLRSFKLMEMLSKETIQSMSVTPDEKIAIFGSSHDTLYVWNLEGGVCLKTLKLDTNEGKISNVSITPDGRIAVSQGSKVIRMWDVENGKCLKIFKGHQKNSHLVGISADGRIAVLEANNVIQLWNLESGLEKLNKVHKLGIRRINMSSNGENAVSLGEDENSLHVWNVQNGKCLRTLAHTKPVTEICVSPDRKIIISGSKDNTVYVWDMENGGCLKTLKGHTKSVSGVAMSPDKKIAFSGSLEDKNLHMWDLESGNCLKKIERHTDQSIVNINIMPDGKTAFSESKDALHIWDLRKDDSRKDDSRLDKLKDALDLGKDDNRLDKLNKLKESNKNLIVANCLMPDGKAVVSVSLEYPDTLFVMNLRGDLLMKCSIPIGLDYINMSILRHFDYTERIKKLNVTPDGKAVVSVSGVTQNIHIWNLRYSEITYSFWRIKECDCLMRLEGHTASPSDISVAPDGKIAVSGSYDKTLRVWDIESGECIAIYQAKEPISLVSEISANGYFAYGTDSGEVIFLRLHNIQMGPPITTPVRLWLHEEKPHNWFAGLIRGKGRWDDNITTFCHWCLNRFPISDEITDVITGIARNADLTPRQSPCLTLPDEAWDEPKLLSECPLCKKPLKFNPFIVDNRGRY